MFSAWSNQPPPRYEVIHEVGDEMCTVVFYTSVHSHFLPDGDTAYSSKLLCLTVAYKQDILTDIRNNYTEWLAMAFEDYYGGEADLEEIYPELT